MEGVTFDEIAELLNEFDSDLEIDTVEFQKGFEKLPKEVRADLRQALKDVLKYKEDLPDDLLKAVQLLAKEAAERAYGYGIKKGLGLWPSLNCLIPPEPTIFGGDD